MASLDGTFPSSLDKAATNVELQNANITNAQLTNATAENLKYGYDEVGPVTSNTILTSRSLIDVDSGAAIITVTLATELLTSASDAAPVVVVNDWGGNAGTNNITIDTEGAASIDGGTSVSIANNNGALALINDGTNWKSVGSTAGGGTL